VPSAFAQWAGTDWFTVPRSEHGDYVNAVCFTADGRAILSASHDHTVKLWDGATGDLHRTMTGHEGPVTGVAVFPEGDLAVSGSSDGTVRIWEIRTGTQRDVLMGHEGPVTGVTVSPDGRWIASSSEDRSIRLWDARSGQWRKILRGHEHFVTCLAISPDGKTLVSGSVDETLKEWSLPDGRELRTYRGHRGAVNCVAFHPDGGSFVSGSSDRSLRRWDVRSGLGTATYAQHVRAIQAVAIHPNGRYLYSGGEDDLIAEWDLSTGEILRGFRVPFWIKGLAFNRDGSEFVSGLWDNSVLHWKPQHQNSLGMEFIEVPHHPGVFLCRTETRRRDFEAFVRETSYEMSYIITVFKVEGSSASLSPEDGASWQRPGFEQGDLHPVVGVSWYEAKAFAEWLSEKEPGVRYRLPTDAEWQAAVGTAKYPWGEEWFEGYIPSLDTPPCNIWDLSIVWTLPGGQDWHVPGGGYRDDGVFTVAATSYGPNWAGFFNMGGNAAEWCEDFFRDSMNEVEARQIWTDGGIEAGSRDHHRVIRGGSWYEWREPFLRSHYRSSGQPDWGQAHLGFRLVAELE